MSTRLIETWLPIAELSEESFRERRSMTALPPIYYPHVWWARQPRVALRAGFSITASWPINTEAEGSLHIKDKSAANNTIFLVCRPRPPKAAADDFGALENLRRLLFNKQVPAPEQLKLWA